MMNKIFLILLTCNLVLLGCGTVDPTLDAKAGPDITGTQLAALSASLGTDCTLMPTSDGGPIAHCSNGCKLFQKPGGVPVMRCPSQETVEICAQPADDTKGCWDGPKFTCGGSSDPALWACSADGTMCCHLWDNCLPCGWVACDWPEPGQAMPDACKVPHDDPQWLTKCPAGLSQQMHCPICAGVLICPDGTPTEIAPH